VQKNTGSQYECIFCSTAANAGREFEKRPRGTWDMLRAGAERASVIAEETMTSVREAVGLPAIRRE